MANNNSLRDEARLYEGEGSALGFVKVTVEESEGDMLGQILHREVGKPSFFDNGVIQTMLFEFVNESAARDMEYAGLKIDSGGGFVLGGFGGETQEAIVGVKTFNGQNRSFLDLRSRPRGQVFMVFERTLLPPKCFSLGLPQNLCQFDRCVAAITAKFYKITLELSASFGQFKDFGGFDGGDLVVSLLGLHNRLIITDLDDYVDPTALAIDFLFNV